MALRRATTARALGVSAEPVEIRPWRAMERWPILKEVFPVKEARRARRGSRRAPTAGGAVGVEGGGGGYVRRTGGASATYPGGIGWLHLRRTISQRDWDSFLAVYGIPSLFMVGPPNLTEAKAAEYQAIAEAVLSDGRGYLPKGSDVKNVDGGKGKPPFREHLDYLDRQVTMVGTGGLLTMLTEAGSGTLAGGAHAEAFRQVARGDTAVLSEALQRDFDLPLLASVFGDVPPLAYFEFSLPSEGNPSKVVDDAVKLAGAGYPVQAEEVSEKTGYQLEGGEW